MPSLPEKPFVAMAKSRSQPSSWELETRSFIGQVGHVIALSSRSGGRGMSSKLVTDAAPWRMEVPMQSEPVSPPPRTTTCLPVARICAGHLVARLALVLLREEVHGEVDAVEVAPGDVEVARVLAAAGEDDGLEVLEEAARVAADADVDAGAGRPRPRRASARRAGRCGASPS